VLRDKLALSLASLEDLHNEVTNPDPNAPNPNPSPSLTLTPTLTLTLTQPLTTNP